jgi:hypothetical protein
MLAELRREFSAAKIESVREANRGDIAGLSAPGQLPISAIRSMRKSGVYRAAFLAGQLQAQLAAQFGALSTDQFRQSGMYCGALAMGDLGLDLLQRGPTGVAEAHALATHALNSDGVALTDEDDRAFLAWLASRAGMSVTPGVVQRLLAVRSRFAALDHSRELREHLVAVLGDLGPELGRACLSYDTGLRSEAASNLLEEGTPASVAAAHRVAWNQVVSDGCAVTPGEESAVLEWLASRSGVAIAQRSESDE